MDKVELRGEELSSFITFTDIESINQVHKIYYTLGETETTLSGDSGGPVYTVPNTVGDAYIVGIHIGDIQSGGKPAGTAFDSWSDITEELDLKPIPTPDGPTRPAAKALAGLF